MFSNVMQYQCKAFIFHHLSKSVGKKISDSSNHLHIKPFSYDNNWSILFIGVLTKLMQQFSV